MRYSLTLTLLITVLYCATFIANAANIEDGLWMYLPLNEGKGEKVRDHGPHKFETELSPDVPKWVDAGHDEITKALEFDGKSNFVKIDMETQGNDIDSHFDENKGLTICAWVKVLATAVDGHGQTRQPIVIKGFHEQWEFALYINDDFGAGMSVWNCAGGGVAETASPGAAPQGTWIHQCGTFKISEGSRVYINGSNDPVAQIADNGIPCETGPRPVFIGHREDGQWLNAIIAEVYMWDRVIDNNEMILAMKSIGGLTVQPGGKLTTTWGNVKRR